MKAIVKPTLGPGLCIADVPIPEVDEGEVLIRVTAASICGSDLPIFDWNDPWTQSVIQVGQVVGHEFCGVIAEIGHDVYGLDQGQLVTAEGHLFCGACWHCRNNERHICPNLRLVGFDFPGAFAEYIKVPAKNVIPLGRTPPSIAAILDPFGNAVHAATRVTLTNRSVLISGCGPLGLMAVMLASVSGAKAIIATDVSDYRLHLAQNAGATISLHASADDLDDIVLAHSEASRGVDVFIDMSGIPEAIVRGLRLLRNGGDAVLMGLPKTSVPINVSDDIVAKGLTVYGVVGRRIFETWSQSLSFLSNPRVTQHLSELVTHRYLIDEFERGFDLMRRGLCGKVLLYFQPEDRDMDQDLLGKSHEVGA